MNRMDLLEKKGYKWLVLALATYSQASATFVTYGVSYRTLLRTFGD
jgi:hypothetical protein